MYINVILFRENRIAGHVFCNFLACIQCTHFGGPTTLKDAASPKAFPILPTQKAAVRRIIIGPPSLFSGSLGAILFIRNRTPLSRRPSALTESARWGQDRTPSAIREEDRDDLGRQVRRVRSAPPGGHRRRVMAWG